MYMSSVTKCWATSRLSSVCIGRLDHLRAPASVIQSSIHMKIDPWQQAELHEHWTDDYFEWELTSGSGVFRGRAAVRCPPPLAWPWKFFKATLYEKVRFCRFPARIAKFNNVWWSFFIPTQYAIKIAMWDCIWYDDVIFCVFEFQKKWANLRLPLNVQKQKVFQLQGGFAPDPPTRGFAPGPRWGLRPQTPVVGSRSRHAPFCQILSTPLTPGLTLWTVCYRRVKKKY